MRSLIASQISRRWLVHLLMLIIFTCIISPEGEVIKGPGDLGLDRREGHGENWEVMWAVSSTGRAADS